MKVSSLRIIRIINTLITFVTVYIAGVISLHHLSVEINIFFASLSAAFIAAAGNIVNDIFDFENDKTNHPNRPLIKGEINIAEAIFLYVFFSITGVALSFAINVHTFVIALSVTVLLFLYSCCLKKIPLLGNFLVSLLTALAFIYGGVAVEKINFVFFPALFAFLVNFAREILKDVEDIEGDRKTDIKTYPIVHGVGNAIMFSKTLILLLLIATITAYLLGIYSEFYLIPIAFTDILLIYFLIGLKNIQSKEKLMRMDNLLKLSMVIGLIGIWVGAK